MALPCASNDGKNESIIIRPHKQNVENFSLRELSSAAARAALPVAVPCEGAWLSADDEPPENEKKSTFVSFIQENVTKMYLISTNFFNAFGVCLKNHGFDVVN